MNLKQLLTTTSSGNLQYVYVIDQSALMDYVVQYAFIRLIAKGMEQLNLKITNLRKK